MPHMSIKMIEGRSDEQKKRLVEALKETMLRELPDVHPKYVSVSIEDFNGQEWQEVFKEEITDKQDKMFIQPGYDPESLL